MKALALILTLGGSLLTANLATAQTHPKAPSGEYVAPPAREQGSAGNEQGGGGEQNESSNVERVSPRDAQQLSLEPEVQEGLNGFPAGAKEAMSKAAQNGQLIGVSEHKSHGGDTYYGGGIVRDGMVFEVKVDSDGKLLSWHPKLAK